MSDTDTGQWALWQQTRRCPAPRRFLNWVSLTSRSTRWPLHVTLIVVGAVFGPSNFGALVPALATWLREDATSSLVTGLPDPVGESAFLLGLLPLRVGTFWLSTCPLIKGDPSWPDAIPNVAPLRLARLP